jgi:hypothetical protein
VAHTYLEYGSYFSKWKERLAIKLWSGWPTFPQVFVDGRGPAYRVGRSDSLTGAAAGANLAGMLTILEAIVGALLAALRPRASLVAENLVLRHTSWRRCSSTASAGRSGSQPSSACSRRRSASSSRATSSGSHWGTRTRLRPCEGRRWPSGGRDVGDVRWRWAAGAIFAHESTWRTDRV